MVVGSGTALGRASWLARLCTWRREEEEEEAAAGADEGPGTGPEGKAAAAGRGSKRASMRVTSSR